MAAIYNNMGDFYIDLIQYLIKSDVAQIIVGPTPLRRASTFISQRNSVFYNVFGHKISVILLSPGFLKSVKPEGGWNPPTPHNSTI